MGGLIAYTCQAQLDAPCNVAAFINGASGYQKDSAHNPKSHCNSGKRTKRVLVPFIFNGT